MKTNQPDTIGAIKLPVREEGLRLRDAGDCIIARPSDELSINDNEANLRYIANCINVYPEYLKLKRESEWVPIHSVEDLPQADGEIVFKYREAKRSYVTAWSVLTAHKRWFAETFSYWYRLPPQPDLG